MDSTGFVINEFIGPAGLPGNRIMRLCHFVFHTSYFILHNFPNIWQYRGLHHRPAFDPLMR